MKQKFKLGQDVWFVSKGCVRHGKICAIKERGNYDIKVCPEYALIWNDVSGEYMAPSLKKLCKQIIGEDAIYEYALQRYLKDHSEEEN